MDTENIHVDWGGEPWAYEYLDKQCKEAGFSFALVQLGRRSIPTGIVQYRECQAYRVGMGVGIGGNSCFPPSLSWLELHRVIRTPRPL